MGKIPATQIHTGSASLSAVSFYMSAPAAVDYKGRLSREREEAEHAGERATLLLTLLSF